MASLDINDQVVSSGDRVIVIQAPLGIVGMGPDALSAFSAAIGTMLTVESIDSNGLLELEMAPPRFVNWDTIWIEPRCVRRVGAHFPKITRLRMTDTNRPRFSAPINPRSIYMRKRAVLLAGVIRSKR